MVLTCLRLRGWFPGKDTSLGCPELVQPFKSMEANVDRIDQSADFFFAKHPSPVEIRNNLGAYLILEARPTECLFRRGCTSML